MTEEKTKLQWFEDYLPADVAALAINNTEELRLNEQSESLDDALHGAFVWAKTDQGHKFWDNIANTKSRWMEASIELCELEECGSCDGNWTASGGSSNWLLSNMLCLQWLWTKNK